jgi:hypothetical protein
MTYRLAFDVSQQIPEIAVGAAAAVLVFSVIAVGLLAFDDLLHVWRPLAVASLGLAVVMLLLEQSRTYLIPIAFGAIGTGVDVLRDRVEAFTQIKVPRGTVATITCTFVLVIVAASGLGRFAAVELTNRLNAGNAEVLEGEVTQFVGGPKTECFTVEDRRFCYSDAGIRAGFTRSSMYGGPIEPGLPVRVSAIGDTIVRLEVATPSPTPSAAP